MQTGTVIDEREERLERRERNGDLREQTDRLQRRRKKRDGNRKPTLFSSGKKSIWRCKVGKI